MTEEKINYYHRAPSKALKTGTVLYIVKFPRRYFIDLVRI